MQSLFFNKFMKSKQLLYIFSIFGIFTGTVNAANQYCGLNCLYTIMKIAGRNMEFSELVKPEYIGSSKGSSLAELKQAAEDNGLYTEAVSKMTGSVLEECRYPVILHVKSEAASDEYDHYVLFLGMEDGKAKIFDPPNPVKLVSFAELAPLWDGNGLFVSAEPIELASVFAPARKRFILYSVIIIIAILLIHWMKRFVPVTLYNSWLKRIGISVAQAAGFAIAAVFIGMFYHFSNETGFLASANATASIQQAHQGNFIPKISEAKVEQLLNTDTIFIDARLTADYEAGHLEGAISIPVNSTDEQRQQATASLAKDANIVLYCQSSGCQYAEKVAVKLIADGFTNIKIYKGGWMDWTAKNSEDRGTS